MKELPLLQTRKCEYSKCGEDYIPVRKWQKFCCEPHRYKNFTEKQEAQDKVKSLERRVKALESMLKSKEREKEHGREGEVSNRIDPKAARVGGEEPGTGTLSGTDGDEGVI